MTIRTRAQQTHCSKLHCKQHFTELRTEGVSYCALCCRQHAARYESEFFEDMDSLGCRRPDAMTRVSEYMSEIVEYIQTIMGNNMAYESNGSVHFDTQAFRYMISPAAYS